MNLKHKHYPHPVLESQFKDRDPDFKNSFFDISVNYHLNATKTELIIETIFDLENKSLINLIDSGKAVFTLLFVCDSTSIRILKRTNQKEIVFKIPTKRLNKTVMIYPFVLANKDVKKYRNCDLTEPINNLSFQIKKGDILAIAPNYELYIEKETLFEIGSIFDIVKLDRRNAPLLSFDCNQSKIQIHLPTDTYKKVKEISLYTGPINHVLISLFYVPAIVYSLQSIVNLQKDPDGHSQLLEYKDFNWYRTLELKLIKFQLGESLADINEDNIVNVAHRLMEAPIDKALIALEDIVLNAGDNE